MAEQDCRRCYFSQVPAINDRFFIEAVRPYCWFAAVLLFLSYIIGLWFTLRTHAATIWNVEIEEKKFQPTHLPNGSLLHHPIGPVHGAQRQQQSGSTGGSMSHNQIRDSPLYKRILGQSLKQVGLEPRGTEGSRHQSTSSTAPHGQVPQTPHLVPPKSSGGETWVPDNASQRSVQISGLSEEENIHLVRQVAEMAATAATVAARDATRVPRKSSAVSQAAAHHAHRPVPNRAATVLQEENDDPVAAEAGAGMGDGGHDAPNWSRLKSAVILLGATLLYAVIAEILVDTVDVVLESVDIDEKFLGITLFALVPNTTEFLVSPMPPLLSSPHSLICFSERHLLRHERQYRAVHGDRFRIRFAGLSAADPGAGSLQRLAFALVGAGATDGLHLQVGPKLRSHLASMPSNTDVFVPVSSSRNGTWSP